MQVFNVHLKADQQLGLSNKKGNGQKQLKKDQVLSQSGVWVQNSSLQWWGMICGTGEFLV